MRPMPTINPENLTGEAQEFAKAIIANQGKNKGRLRNARAKDFSDEQYYVWRMVSFYASPDPKASCMPMGAMYTLSHSAESVGHSAECPRDWRFFGSIEKAYVRGTGLWNEEGNYRLDCTCGHSQRHLEAKAQEKLRDERLNAIIETILRTIPLKEQYGVRRWNKAFSGSDPFDQGDIFDNVSAHLTGEEVVEGVLM